MTIDPKYKYSELTEMIIGVFYEVYNELGFGFLESVYRKAMKLALEAKGFRVEEEAPTSVFFRGTNVGDFKADLIVNGIILLPNCRQARAQLECDLNDCCLRARSASERRIPQPPSPPEFGVDRAQVFA